MIKRTVEFTITNGGVTPSIPQYGGVKGEHKATLLKITLPGGLYSAGDVARLSFTTGDGTVLSSDILDVTALGTYIEYALPQLLTVAAGQLCARVVISHMENGEETQTQRLPEMVLYFEEASVENGTPFWTGVSEMLQRTTTASGAAVDAQGKAENAANAAAENVKEQLQEFVADAETAKSGAERAREQAVTNAGKAGNFANAAQHAQEAARAAAALAQEAVNTPGRKGEDGKSAYELAVANGFEGDEATWLESLKGKKGKDGESPTVTVQKYDDGSGVLVAVLDASGLKQFVITNGKDGKSAYEFAKEGGYEGTEEEFAALLIANAKSDLLRFRGSMVGSAMDMLANKQLGDVVFCTTDSRFYLWNGAKWTPLVTGAQGATPAEVIAAMNTEVWAFEMEDGTTVEKAVPTV